MNKPIDYPLPADLNSPDIANAAMTNPATDTPLSEITFATLKDRVAAKKPVTDEMIRIARIKLETAQSGPQ